MSAEANPFFLEHGGKPIRSRDGKPNLTAVIEMPRDKNHAGRSEQMSIFPGGMSESMDIFERGFI